MSDALTTNSDDLFVSSAGMVSAVNYGDWTFSLFAPFVRGSVLEVGCGVATFTRRILGVPTVQSLVSIDISAPAVDACRRSIHSPVLDLRNADVLEVSGAFDLVVCMNVLEHIEDDRGALAHMLS